MNKHLRLLLLSLLTFGFVFNNHAMEKQSGIVEIDEDTDEIMEEVEIDDIPVSSSGKRKRSEEDDGGKPTGKRQKQKELPLVTLGNNETLGVMSTHVNSDVPFQLKVLPMHQFINLIKTRDTKTLAVILPLMVNFSDKDGKNFLHILSEEGNNSAIEYILNTFREYLIRLKDAFDNDYHTPVFYAVLNGHHNVVESLLGLDISLSHIFDENKKQTLTHIAAEKKYGDIVVQLLKKSPGTIDKKDAVGKKPLHAAVESNCDLAVSQILNLFLDKSFMKGLPKNVILKNLINSKDNDGKTCLHFAVIVGNTQTIRDLLGKGADINAIDKDQRTPLHLLLFLDDRTRKPSTATIVNIFMDAKGFNIFTTDKDGKKAYEYLEEKNPIRMSLKKHENEKLEKQELAKKARFSLFGYKIF